MQHLFFLYLFLHVTLLHQNVAYIVEKLLFIYFFFENEFSVIALLYIHATRVTSPFPMDRDLFGHKSLQEKRKPI